LGEETLGEKNINYNGLGSYQQCYVCLKFMTRIRFVTQLDL